MTDQVVAISAAAAAATTTTAPLFILVLAFQRQMVNEFAAGAHKN